MASKGSSKGLRFRHRFTEVLRRNFVAGLLVFVPVGLTILGVLWIVDQLDNLVLPRAFALVGMEAQQPPFVGAIATLCVILLAGALARSVVGRAAVGLWESSVDRIPVARSLYSVLKQFMQAVFGEDATSGFKRVVLIEYPRRELWCYGFVTGRLSRTIEGLPEDLLKIFIPSTPNPTTGYFLMVPEADVVDTHLGVEEAFRLIISAGITGAEVGPAPVARPARVEESAAR